MTENEKLTEQKWNELFEACNSLPIFTQWMKLVPPRVDEALAGACDRAKSVPPRLKDAMKYSLLAPGKRFRPMLVYLAAMLCNKKYALTEILERATPAACAVEMIHAYSLIHDDLPAMDDDDLRRGRPTCHKRFDEATAILAGDALLTLAFEVLTDAPNPKHAVKFLAQAAGHSGMVGGQIDDLEPNGDAPACECLLKLFCDDGGYESFCRTFQIDEKEAEATLDYIQSLRERSARWQSIPPKSETEKKLRFLESMQNRKTGALIAVSLLLGALAADATAQQAMRLVRFGQFLGLMFQVTDDLLDVTGTAAEVGKNVGKDTDAGKLTWPGLLGIDCCEILVCEMSRRAMEEVSSPCFGGRERVLENLLEFLRKRRA